MNRFRVSADVPVPITQSKGTTSNQNADCRTHYTMGTFIMQDNTVMSGRFQENGKVI